jgi:NADPH:quinone reductase-like Zn-dependent oxidoreductase
VGVTTVGQSLYQSLGLPLPDSGTKADCPILIYGGSSATGSLAIQYARLSGCTQIITTCSPRNFDFVKSLGAHVALDYRDPGCAKKIRELTNDSLAHVLDCITSDESVALCQAAVGSKGGTIAYLLRANKHERTDVQAKYPLGYTVIGEGFSSSWMKAEFPASAEDFEFGKVFWQLSEKLFAEGKLRVHPPQVEEGGLYGVFDGFQKMREGKVSGVKLVYRVEDTNGVGEQK